MCWCCCHRWDRNWQSRLLLLRLHCCLFTCCLCRCCCWLLQCPRWRFVADEKVIDHGSASVNHSCWIVRTIVALCRHSDHCSGYLRWCCTLRLCSSSLCGLVVQKCNKQYVLFLVLLTCCMTFHLLCHVDLWKAFLVQSFLFLLLTVNCSFLVDVDCSSRNLFLCCPSCLSCLYVFLTKQNKTKQNKHTYKQTKQTQQTNTTNKHNKQTH